MRRRLNSASEVTMKPIKHSQQHLWFRWVRSLTCFALVWFALVPGVRGQQRDVLPSTGASDVNAGAVAGPPGEVVVEVAGDGGARLLQLKPDGGARMRVVNVGAGPATEVWVPELDLSEGPVVAFHRDEEGVVVLLVRMSDERRPKIGCHYKIVRVARSEDDEAKWSVEKELELTLQGVKKEGRFVGGDGRRIRFGRPLEAGNLKDGAAMLWTDVVFLESGEARLAGAYPKNDKLVEREDFFRAGANGGVFGSSLQYLRGRVYWSWQERAAEAGFIIREEVSKVVGEDFEAVLRRPSKDVLAVEISPDPGSRVPKLKVSFEGNGIDGGASDDLRLIDVNAVGDEVRLLFLGVEAYFVVRVSRRDGGWKVEDEIVKVNCGKMQGLNGSDYDLLDVGFADDGAVEFVGYHKEKGTGRVRFAGVAVERAELRPEVVGDGEYWPGRFAARGDRLRNRAVVE